MSLRSRPSRLRQEADDGLVRATALRARRSRAPSSRRRSGRRARCAVRRARRGAADVWSARPSRSSIGTAQAAFVSRPPARRARRCPSSASSSASRAAWSSSRMRRASTESVSRSARALRVIVRASAWASETIDSASRLAWSFSSCAARSAETSVVRSSASSSRYRFSSPSSSSTRSAEVGPLAPDGLEALGDLLEQPVDLRRRYAEQAPSQLDVADLDRCVRHGCLPSSAVECSEQPDDELLHADQHEDADDRRQVERPERRQDAPEEPQVRLADVVEEPLEPVQRVRQPDPGRQDVDEDQEDVDVDEDGDEVLRRRDRCPRVGRMWRKLRPRAGFGPGRRFPTGSDPKGLTPGFGRALRQNPRVSQPG